MNILKKISVVFMLASAVVSLIAMAFILPKVISLSNRVESQRGVYENVDIEEKFASVEDAASQAKEDFAEAKRQQEAFQSKDVIGTAESMIERSRHMQEESEVGFPADFIPDMP